MFEFIEKGRRRMKQMQSFSNSFFHFPTPVWGNKKEPREAAIIFERNKKLQYSDCLICQNFTRVRTNDLLRKRWILNRYTITWDGNYIFISSSQMLSLRFHLLNFIIFSSSSLSFSHFKSIIHNWTIKIKS